MQRPAFHLARRSGTPAKFPYNVAEGGTGAYRAKTEETSRGVAGGTGEAGWEGRSGGGEGRMAHTQARIPLSVIARVPAHSTPPVVAQTQKRDGEQNSQSLSSKILVLHGTIFPLWAFLYRAEKKSLQILLSSTQAGPGRKVKQEQEDISRNHVPRLFLSSVHAIWFIKRHCEIGCDITP